MIEAYNNNISLMEVVEKISHYIKQAEKDLKNKGVEFVEERWFYLLEDEDDMENLAN